MSEAVTQRIRKLGILHLVHSKECVIQNETETHLQDIKIVTPMLMQTDEVCNCIFVNLYCKLYAILPSLYVCIIVLLFQEIIVWSHRAWYCSAEKADIVKMSSRTLSSLSTPSIQNRNIFTGKSGNFAT